MKMRTLIKIARLVFADRARNDWNESGLVSPLSEACIMANPLLVRWLIATGADCDGNPEEGRSPLYYLVSGDCTADVLACARLLLAAGVDPLQLDDQALSAVQRAEMEGKDEMKGRGRPSPNCADALCMTFASGESVQMLPSGGRMMALPVRQISSLAWT